MPIFRLQLRVRDAVEPSDLDIEFRDLHQAYLEVHRAIPDVARDLLIGGQDPMTSAYIICDQKGRRLMEVPFAEILKPAEWKLRKTRRRPLDRPRSLKTRDRLALDSFRRMFSSVNAGCVLMTPELQVVEMNEFGARHSHVDAEAIRGTSILDIFDLHGEPKRDFNKFIMLAREGATSEVIDMPYYVLDAAGETVEGWWNARTWPIFDDDDRILGLVEWAEPFTKPTNRGNTLVRLAPGSAK